MRKVQKVGKRLTSLSRGARSIPLIPSIPDCVPGIPAIRFETISESQSTRFCFPEVPRGVATGVSCRFSVAVPRKFKSPMASSLTGETSSRWIDPRASSTADPLGNRKKSSVRGCSSSSVGGRSVDKRLMRARSWRGGASDKASL